MTNLRTEQGLGKVIKRRKDYVPRCGGYRLICKLLERHKTRLGKRGLTANWDESPSELMKTSRVSSHVPRSIKYLDEFEMSQGNITRKSAHVQKGAKYDDDHEYKESERQERVLRTSEREVHDLDRTELPRSRISITKEAPKKREHTAEGYCYNGMDERREANETCAGLRNGRAWTGGCAVTHLIR